MVSLVHVHSDPKFLNETDRFNKRWFNNTIVTIGDRSGTGIWPDSHVRHFADVKADVLDLVDMCSGADAVVLYDLDDVKSQFALMLPEDIAVAWRFFGYELYARSVADYVSPTSLRFHKSGTGWSTVLSWKSRMRRILVRANLKSDHERTFAEAIQRTDVFLGLSKNEYDQLCRTWHDLPRFVQLPLESKSPKRHLLPKDDFVIVGNNRSIYNNHLDIIDLIENTRHNDHVSFLLPFNYGLDNEYSNEVKRRVQSTRHEIRLMVEFMPREAYFDMVTRAKAYVSNSYRQLGMGNILEFMNAGVKVYMNRRNVMHGWLADLGLKVYTIEDFARDLESNNLELSSDEKEWNCRVVLEFSTKFSDERFFHDFTAAIGKRDRRGRSFDKAR
jgi:hypothetical protein